MYCRRNGLGGNGLGGNVVGAPTAVRAGAHEADERRGRGAGDAAARRECAKRRAGVGAVLRARRPAEPAQREAT